MKNPNARNISLSEKAVNQIGVLAERWGMPEVRHISAVIEVAIERAYTEELAGIKVEALSILEGEEIRQLLMLLAAHIYDLKQQDDTTEEIATTENLIAKIRGIR